jgi:hypothetical protein
VRCRDLLRSEKSGKWDMQWGMNHLREAVMMIDARAFSMSTSGTRCKALILGGEAGWEMSCVHLTPSVASHVKSHTVSNSRGAIKHHEPTKDLGCRFKVMWET